MGPQCAGELQRRVGQAHDVHFRIHRQREQRDKQADCAGTQHQEPVAWCEAGCLDRPQRAPPRFDEHTGRQVHRVRQRMQRGDRDGHLLGQRAGPATADPDLEAVPADVLPAS